MAIAFDALVLDFLVVLSAALAASVLSQKMRFPPVVALIFFGVVMGPNVLGWVGQSELIEVFAEIGSVLLLFYIGIEFDFPKLVRVAAKAVFFAFCKLLFVFLIVYEVALLLGLGILTAAVLGFALSLTSTSIMVRILEQKGLVGRSEVPVLVAALIVEDLLAIVGLTMLSSLNAAGFSLREGLLSILFSLVLLGMTYVVLFRVLRRVSAFFDFANHEDSLVFFSLTLCLALSVFAFWLGLSAAIGAFVAGSLISALNTGEQARVVTNPLGLAFSSIFFVSIGLLVDPNALLAEAGIVIVLIVVQVLALIVGIFGAARLIGLSSNQAAFSAFALPIVGEFSLLLAREAAPLASANIVGIVSVSVLVTTLFSSFWISRFESLLSLRKKVPVSLARALASVFWISSRVVASIEYGGKLHRVLIREFSDRQQDVWKIFSAGFVVLVLHYWMPNAVILVNGYSVSVFLLSLVVWAGVVLYSILRIGSSIFHLLDVFEESVLPSTNGGVRRLGEYAMGIVLCVVGLIVFPFLVTWLQLPAVFLWLRFLLLLPLVLFISWALRGIAMRKSEAPIE